MFRVIIAFSFLTMTLAAETNRGLDRLKPFFKKYCIECHGPTKSKGGITLHNISGDLSQARGLEHWENILEVISKSEMPPEDEKQPREAVRQAVAKLIDSSLKSYISRAGVVQSAPTARRLTNFEYQNTIRDLFGVELDLIGNLPEDPYKPYEFNNKAKYMLMGMEQLDRYKENAYRIMKSVIINPAPPEIHKSSSKWENLHHPAFTGGRYSDEIHIDSGSSQSFRHMGIKSWSETGKFRVRIKAAAVLPKGYSEVPMMVQVGYNLGHNSSTLQVKPVGTALVKADVDNPEVYEFTGRVENFPIEESVGRDGKKKQVLYITPRNIFDDGRLSDHVKKLKRPRIVVKEIEFESPVFDQWPPKHHRDILFESSLRKDNPDDYVKEVLKRFLKRAFRRPATTIEVDKFYKIYQVVAPGFTTFEEAMRETLATVLISPEFMYHMRAEENGSHRHYEIASRLSYFLWGSMPDEELFRLAEQQKLTNSQVVESQVRRMLNDKKSADFVRNFTLQWLSIEKMQQVAISKELFPRFLFKIDLGERSGQEVPYRPTIRDYMMKESPAFVAELIRRNAPVAQLIHSDFAMLNSALAGHYGVEEVDGISLRPVKLKPEHNLGGLLTHGSVLIGNSTGSAPHPIYRAVWLREAILGEEVKDPPAEVPALEDSTGKSAEKALSIKDLLAKHRQVESCNDCHARLDPWGIPFETYNSVGQYQPMVPKEGTRVRGMKNNRYVENESLAEYKEYLKQISAVKVDSTTRVPHGPKVTGMADLKKHIIRNRLDDVAKNMIERFMTYAMGRDLTYRDRYQIEELLKKSKKNSYRLQDMIVLICQSQLFIEGR